MSTVALCAWKVAGCGHVVTEPAFGTGRPGCLWLVSLLQVVIAYLRIAACRSSVAAMTAIHSPRSTDSVACSGESSILTRRSLATVTLGRDLAQKLSAAARAGFTGVEICQGDLDPSALTPREVEARAAEVRARAGDLGLRVDSWQPLRDFEAVTPARLQENLARARQTLTLTQMLGAGTLIVCSNTAPDAIGDDWLAADQLCMLATVAADYGAQVAYEPLSWGTRIASYQHAWRVVQAAAHSNLGICLDSFHILATHAPLDGIHRIPADSIFAVQLAGGHIRPGLGYLEWSRHHRCLPGDGGLDVAAFAAEVAATGWRGPWSLEIFSDQHQQDPPMRVAAACMRSLDSLERVIAGRAAQMAPVTGAR